MTGMGHGGRREGAGRKLKKFTLEVGRKYAICEFLEDGRTPLRPGTVVEVTRTDCTFQMEDGSRVRVIR